MPYERLGGRPGNGYRALNNNRINNARASISSTAAAAFKRGLAIGGTGYSTGHVMHTKQSMTTGNKCHARMIEAIAGGIVADGVAAVDDGLEELDALPVDAAHAGERDGVVDVATSEYSSKMAVLVALAVSLRPDDESRLMRVLDDD